MHKLLQRQLKRLRITDPDQPPSPEQWAKLLESIDRAYTENDQDRYLNERSLEISSEEMQQLYDDLQKSTEVQLAEVNKKLITILGSLHHGVIVFNKEGSLKLFNDAADEIFGRPLDLADRPTIKELFFAPLIAFTGREIPFPSVGSFEGMLQRANGSELPIDLSTSILLIDNELHYITMIRDITVRVETAKALVASKDEAQAANKAKSAFLANMSHEIRTPLNAVIGLSGLMLDTELNAEQQDFMETIRNSGDTLLSILNDILDFSKIEAGHMELEHQPFAITQLIDDVVDLLGAKAAAKGVELLFKLDTQLPALIFGDVTRLRQILINLVGNAVKFTSAGHIMLSAESVTIAESGASGVKFSIKDTGVGIPKDRLNRLFKPFSQVDASTTRKYGGTGLGLAISKQLVELMEGDIHIESEVGRGTCFSFSVPSSAPENTPFLAEKGSLLKGMEIALVHPFDITRRTLCKLLRDWGATTRPYPSQDDLLLDKGTFQAFDCVLIDDLVMLDSPEVYSGETPIIRLVEYGFRNDYSREKGVQILRKPIKFASLWNRLANVASQSGPRKSIPVKNRRDSFENIAELFPLKILVVDDNAVNQKVGINILKRMGYRADKASGGHEALEALRRQHYDLVFLDIQMPDMDGVEVMQIVHSDWDPAEQPYIIALTANVMEGDRERYLSLGFDNYLPKPVRYDDMKKAVQRFNTLKILEPGR